MHAHGQQRKDQRQNLESRKGISEIEGKAAAVAAKKRGQRLSFKTMNQESRKNEIGFQSR